MEKNFHLIKLPPATKLGIEQEYNPLSSTDGRKQECYRCW